MNAAYDLILFNKSLICSDWSDFGLHTISEFEFEFNDAQHIEIAI